MATSILIARLIGPIVLMASFAMVTNPRETQEMTREFLKFRALIFITGILALLGGLSIVNNHNLWIMDWPVIITLFGWAMVIGGSIRIAFSRLVISIGNSMLENPAMIRIAGLIWFFIGASLSYKGYIEAP